MKSIEIVNIGSAGDEVVLGTMPGTLTPIVLGVGAEEAFLTTTEARQILNQLALLIQSAEYFDEQLKLLANQASGVLN